MIELTAKSGFTPLLLCHYGSYAVPLAEQEGLAVAGYAIPLNREWGWFDRDACVNLVRSISKPFIAFMPLASGGLRANVRGALGWLYRDVGVAAVLFGTGSAAHAAETVRIAIEIVGPH